MSAHHPSPKGLFQISGIPLLQQTRTAPNKWLTFSVVAVGVFMSTLDGSIVNIALPAIMADLQAPLATIEWVMLVYLLTISSLLLSFGRLSDIRGRRWVYTRGLLVFSAGSLCCGLAREAGWLIAARAFQGLGAAMIMSCTQAIVVEAFPASERGRAMGMIGAVVASGLTVGPALGGFILHVFNWQTIFYVNIPIGILTAMAAAVLLRGSPSDQARPERFDAAGALLLALSTGTFLYVVTHGYKDGYASPTILILAGVAVLSAAAMILFAGLFTIVFLMPFYLMHPRGLSEHQAGTLMVTLFAFLFVFAPISGSLSDRIGSRMLCTLGMAVVTLSLYLLSDMSPTLPQTDIAWRLGLAGVGTALFTAPNNAAAMGAAPVRYMGIAAGTVATVRNLGMVLGIALAGTIFNLVFFHQSGGILFSEYRPEYEPIFMAAFRNAMRAGAVVSGIGIVVSFMRGPDAP